MVLFHLFGVIDDVIQAARCGKGARGNVDCEQARLWQCTINTLWNEICKCAWTIWIVATCALDLWCVGCLPDHLESKSVWSTFICLARLATPVKPTRRSNGPERRHWICCTSVVGAAMRPLHLPAQYLCQCSCIHCLFSEALCRCPLMHRLQA